MKKRRSSLKRTIFISFVLFNLCSCFLMLFFAVRYSRRSSRNVFKDNMFVTSERINSTISEVILEKYNLLGYLANLSDLRSDDVSLLAKNMLLAPLSRDKGKDLLSLSYIDINGDTYFGPNFKINFGKNETFKQAVSTKKACMAGPSIDEKTKALSINVATPVTNNQNQVIGVVFARFDCSFLCTITQFVTMGNSGCSYVIDRKTGTTIGAANVEDVRKQMNFLNIAKENNNDELIQIINNLVEGKKDVGYFNEGNVRKIVVYEPVENTEWAVLLTADDLEFAQPLKWMENTLIGYSCFIGVIGILISIAIAMTLNPLKKVGSAISEISTGNADLTQRITVKNGKKEIMDIVDGFNAFVEKLQEIIVAVKQSQDNLIIADDSLQNGTQNTSTAISQIIENIENINEQFLGQSQNVEVTASAVNEIASNIDSLKKMIMNQSAGVEVASVAVEQMVGNINAVNTSVEKMAESFTELEQNAQIGISTQKKVNDMLGEIEAESKMLQDANIAISKIAAQTNLLAMNAAIEAAHAGDAGKGFSVVAGEIRKLSETSTLQSKQIGTELQKIQDSIINVVEASSQASDAFRNVSTNIQNTDQLVHQIKNAMDEQNAGSRQITDALHSMNDSTVEVKTASEEMAEGNKMILNEIQKLQIVSHSITDKIKDVADSAQNIDETGSELTNVSSKVTESINSIKGEIDLFKV